MRDQFSRKLQWSQSRNSRERFSRAPVQILHLPYPIRVCDTAAATARTGCLRCSSRPITVFSLAYCGYREAAPTGGGDSCDCQYAVSRSCAISLAASGECRASPILIGGHPCREVLESRESKCTTTPRAIRAPHSTASTYCRLRAAARTGLQGECPVAIVRHTFCVEIRHRPNSKTTECATTATESPGHRLIRAWKFTT